MNYDACAIIIDVYFNQIYIPKCSKNKHSISNTNPRKTLLIYFSIFILTVC